MEKAVLSTTGVAEDSRVLVEVTVDGGVFGIVGCPVIGSNGLMGEGVRVLANLVAASGPQPNKTAVVAAPAEASFKKPRLVILSVIQDILQGIIQKIKIRLYGATSFQLMRLAPKAGGNNRI